MKTFAVIFTLLAHLCAFAHEGHGEMPIEPAKYGGILGNVVSELKVQAKAKHNPPLMKAEIVRSEDGTIRVYLYDLKMQQLKTEGLGPQAKASVENAKAKSKESFMLTAQGDHFKGMMPKQKKKPFDIYVTFTKGTENLFVAFDNLD